MAKLYTKKEIEKLLAKGPAALEIGRTNKTEHGDLIELVNKNADGKTGIFKLKGEEPENNSFFEESPGFVTGDEAGAAQTDEDEELEFFDDVEMTARSTAPREFTQAVMDFAKKVPVGKSGHLPKVEFDKKKLQVVQGILYRLNKKEGIEAKAAKSPRDETKIIIWRL